jgi:hypothetical protein
MAGKKYQSCLVPFENEILTLRRRKPPMSFPQIAEYLKEKYQISVRRQTIETFLKIRLKGFKQCKYAWSINPAKAESQPATELPSVNKQTVSEVRKAPKQPVSVNPTTPTEQETEFKMEWSDVYNLHRLPPEEAAERRRRIAEKRKLMEEQHKGENK